MKDTDYHNYVIKDGVFIGKFDEMYQKCPDPWNIQDASKIQYDLTLCLIKKYCESRSIHHGILDIGCGLGSFTNRIAIEYPDSPIHAIDISETAIQKAIQKNNNYSIRYECLDIRKDLHKIYSTYNMIIVSDVLWYVLPQAKDILQDLYNRVLSHNGVLLINQAFYLPGEQRYGCDYFTTPQELLPYLPMQPIVLIELNMHTDPYAIILLKKVNK